MRFCPKFKVCASFSFLVVGAALAALAALAVVLDQWLLSRQLNHSVLNLKK